MRGIRLIVMGICFLLLSARFSYALDLSNVLFHLNGANGVKALSRGNSEPIEKKGTISFVSGKSGKALELINGMNYLGYETKNNFNSSQGTISFWISPSAGKGTWDGSMANVLQVLFHTAGGPQQMVIQEHWPTRSLVMLFYNNGSLIGGFPAGLGAGVPLYTANDITSVVRPGTWYQIIFTWRKGYAAAYLNGKQESEYSNPQINITNLGNIFYLGWNKTNGQLFIDPGCNSVAKPISEKPWNTLISNFTVYNQFIFPNQAEGIYKYGALGYARKAEPNPISISTAFYPSYHKLYVTIFSPSTVLPDNKGIIIVQNPQGNNLVEKPFSQEEFNKANQSLNLTVNLPDKLANGTYTVSAELLKDGKPDIYSNEKTFEMINYPWVGNKLGEENIVLPPWTPVKVRNDNKGIDISVWGRQYKFNNNPLPYSIISQGKELLQKPINLFFKNQNNQEISPEWTSFNIVKSTPEKVIMQGYGTAGGYNIKAKSRIDYDGFFWLTLTFSSDKGKEIQGLRLDMLMKKQLCTLFQYATSRNYWFPVKGWNSSFQSYVWVGNDKAGLEWFAQSDQYWYAKDPSKRLEVFPTNNGGMMRINIVNDPITMPRNFTISFGLQATPVKSRPTDWRSFNATRNILPWRLADPKRFFNCSFFSMDGTSWSISPAWLIPPKTMKKEKYNPNGPVFYAPFSSTAWLGIRAYSAKNIYNFLPEWRVYQKEWESIPQQIDLGQTPGWNQATINPTQSYIDWYVYTLNNLLKNYNFDGLYLDGFAGQNPSANIKDGFGYVDREGNIKPTYPILAGRELERRIYTIVNKYRGKRGVLVADVQTDILMPVLSFFTGTLDGECMGRWEDLYSKIVASGGWYSSALTPDWLRANFDMKPFGLIPTFDCELSGFMRASHDQDMVGIANELYGLLLANDIQSWTEVTEGTDQGLIQVAVDWWGITGKDVKFLPYWSKNPAVTVSFTPNGKNKAWSNQCYASAYINKKEKKMLIVAINTSAYGLDINRYKSTGNLGYFLHLNLKKLGLADKEIRVTDAESFGTFKLPYNNGIIPLNMDPHGIQLISVTWGGNKGHHFFSFLKDK